MPEENKRTSALAVLDVASVSGLDKFPIVDVSATGTAPTGETKQISVGDVVAYAAVGITQLFTDQTIVTQSGSAYTVIAADKNKLIRLTGTATVTLPSAGPTVGQRVDFVCIGGPATFALGSGATWDVPPTPSAVARAIGSFVTAIKMGATTWALTGDLA